MRPLLIIQGMNDVRVKPQESEQIVGVLQRHGIPVTYATFSDEGHGFVREENRLAFSAVMEAFLGRHLGGIAEPVLDAFSGSTIEFVTAESSSPDRPPDLGDAGGSLPAEATLGSRHAIHQVAEISATSSDWRNNVLV